MEAVHQAAQNVFYATAIGRAFDGKATMLVERSSKQVWVRKLFEPMTNL
jgi:hypothetical protein